MYVKVSDLLAEYPAETIYKMTEGVHCWYDSSDVYFAATIIPFAVDGQSWLVFNPGTSEWDREIMTMPDHLYGHSIQVNNGKSLMYIHMEEVWVNKSNLNLPH